MPFTNDWHPHHAISRFLKRTVWKNTRSFLDSGESPENDAAQDLMNDDSSRSHKEFKEIKYRQKARYYKWMMGSFIFIGLLLIFNLPFIGNGIIKDPPRAMIIPQKFRVRNFTFVDNYSWLRNYSDHQVKKYILAENEYSSLVLKQFDKLQNEIFDEFSNNSNNMNNARFWNYGSWTYYILQPPNLAFPQYYRYRSRNDCQIIHSASDTLILDYNRLISQNESYFMDGIFEISKDGKLIAFGYDLKGNEEFLLRIWDLEIDKEIKIPNVYAYYSLRWVEINNSSWVYYSTVDIGIPRKVYRLCVKYCIGDIKAEFIYLENDLSLTVELKLSSDLLYLFIKSSGQVSSEYRLVNDKKLAVVLIKDEYVMYDMDHYENSFIFRLNNHPFSNYRIIQIPSKIILDNIGTISVLDIDSLHPKTLYAHSSEYIELHEVFKNWMVLWVRNDGLREIRILGLAENSGFKKRISFRVSNDISTESYAVFPGTIDDMESRLYRSYSSECFIFTNSSFSKGVGVYAYKFDMGETTVLKNQKYYQEYFERRVWAKSSSWDIQIPISVISLRNHTHKPLPTIVTSYGSYSTFKDPTFNPDLFPLLDRGVVFAQCHPRGDGDLGSKWYADGKYEKKTNTFKDTQNCIDELINMKIAAQGRIALLTRSAGGLIAGYAINNLHSIAVIVTQVPFIDPIGDLIDETVPWTVYEYYEWGNPVKNETILKAMIEYSPYHNIKSQAYPPIMITAGIQDSRVPFWEPTKFVAKLRASSFPSRNLILKVNDQGHFPNSKKELAEIYSFILRHIGVGF